MPKQEPAPLKFPPSGELADHWQRAVQLAARFPGTEESRSYGTPALKVRGRLLARLRSEAEGGLAIKCEFERRDVLLGADPKTFFLTDHYESYPMVLVRLEIISDEALLDLLEDAWKSAAPERLLRDFRSESS